MEKYLPIGSIVLLKNGNKKLMITGFCVKLNNNDIMYDYSGCLYPEGILNIEELAVFNHEQIEQIISVGYTDIEEQEFKNNLKKALESEKINTNE